MTGREGHSGLLQRPGPSNLEVPLRTSAGLGCHRTFDLQISHNGQVVLVIGGLAEVVPRVVGLEVSDAQGPVGVGEEALVLQHRLALLVQPGASRVDLAQIALAGLPSPPCFPGPEEGLGVPRAGVGHSPLDAGHRGAEGLAQQVGGAALDSHVRLVVWGEDLGRQLCGTSSHGAGLRAMQVPGRAHEQGSFSKEGSQALEAAGDSSGHSQAPESPARLPPCAPHWRCQAEFLSAFGRTDPSAADVPPIAVAQVLPIICGPTDSLPLPGSLPGLAPSSPRLPQKSHRAGLGPSQPGRASAQWHERGQTSPEAASSSGDTDKTQPFFPAPRSLSHCGEGGRDMG